MDRWSLLGWILRGILPQNGSTRPFALSIEGVCSMSKQVEVNWPTRRGGKGGNNGSTGTHGGSSGGSGNGNNGSGGGSQGGSGRGGKW